MDMIALLVMNNNLHNNDIPKAIASWGLPAGSQCIHSPASPHTIFILLGSGAGHGLKPARPMGVVHAQ
jgi:hypothetical protein